MNLLPRSGLSSGVAAAATAVLIALLAIAALATVSPAEAAASVVVNTTNDVDDGTCDATHCSLREAILFANANAGTEITFDETVTLSAGEDLRIRSPLPPVSGDDTQITGDAWLVGESCCLGGPPVGLVVTGDRVVLDGLRVGPFRETAIIVSETVDVEIRNISSNSLRALELVDDTGTRIRDSQFTRGFGDAANFGVISFGSTDLEITGSELLGFENETATGVAIYALNPKDLTIVDNTMERNIDEGIVILTDGTVADAGGIVIDNNSIKEVGVRAILVSGINDASITRNAIWDSGFAGIVTLGSSNVRIGDADDPSMANTIVRGAFGGIHILDGSSDVSVIGGNNITQNGVLGIWIDQSSSLGSIGGIGAGQGNIIRNNVGLGIWLQRGSEATIRGNDFGNNVSPGQPAASGDILLDPGTNGDVLPPDCARTEGLQWHVWCVGEPNATVDLYAYSFDSPDGNEIVRYVGSMTADDIGLSSTILEDLAVALRATQTTVNGHTSDFMGNFFGPIVPRAPAVLTLARPASMQVDVARTFSATYQDTNGADEINVAAMWVTPDGDLLNDCFACGPARACPCSRVMARPSSRPARLGPEGLSQTGSAPSTQEQARRSSSAGC